MPPSARLACATMLPGAAGPATLAGAAHAADGKVYPGAHCVSSYFHSVPVTRYLDGSISPTTQNMSLACPVVTDNETNSHALSRANVLVYQPSGATQSTGCWVLSYSTTGLVLDSRNGFATNPGNQTLSLAFDSTQADVNRVYNVACDMVKGAFIYQYEIEER
jgi:hypothetical protein